VLMSGMGLVSVLVAALASVSSVHIDGGCVLDGQLVDGSIKDEQVKAKTNKQQAKTFFQRSSSKQRKVASPRGDKAWDWRTAGCGRAGGGR
jgi:hypothetical protein